MYPSTQKEILKALKENDCIVAHLKSWASIRGLLKQGYRVDPCGGLTKGFYWVSTR